MPPELTRDGVMVDQYYNGIYLGKKKAGKHRTVEELVVFVAELTEQVHNLTLRVNELESRKG